LRKETAAASCRGGVMTETEAKAKPG